MGLYCKINSCLKRLLKFNINYELDKSKRLFYAFCIKEGLVFFFCKKPEIMGFCFDIVI